MIDDRGASHEGGQGIRRLLQFAAEVLRNLCEEKYRHLLDVGNPVGLTTELSFARLIVKKSHADDDDTADDVDAIRTAFARALHPSNGIATGPALRLARRCVSFELAELLLPST